MRIFNTYAVTHGGSEYGMKYLLCPDSFKGSLTSPEMCDALERGIRKRDIGASVRKMPLADGGEGTAQALCAALGGEITVCDAVDPFGTLICAEYAAVPDRSLAMIDMAAASALSFAKKREDFGHGGIMRASTFGTGLMILHALSMGYRDIIVGLGGSATNDGGTGAAGALGMKFFAADGSELAPNGGAAILSKIASVSADGLCPELREAHITLLYDVDIPLAGEHGTSRNYAPQKGATQEESIFLDSAMESFADAAEKSLNKDLRNTAGAGAAGGLGFGLALCGGELHFGAPFVLDVCGFDKAAADADVIITGEGKCDGQTVNGKLPSWVVRRAKAVGGGAVVCVCGLDNSVPGFYELGADTVFALADGPITLEDSMDRCAELTEKAAFNIAGFAAAMERRRHG